MIIESAKPIADTEIVAWAPSSGVTLYDKIDELVADDLDYINSTAATNNAKFKLSTMQRLSIGGSLAISLRIKFDVTPYLSVQLLQGTSVIAERLIDGSLWSGYNLVQIVLRDDEFDLISDVADLYVNFIAESELFALLNEGVGGFALEDGSGRILLERST